MQQSPQVPHQQMQQQQIQQQAKPIVVQQQPTQNTLPATTANLQLLQQHQNIQQSLQQQQNFWPSVSKGDDICFDDKICARLEQEEKLENMATVPYILFSNLKHPNIKKEISDRQT